MKIKIIILLLILVNLSYSKDSLKVNAILYRLGSPTTLDKITVINKETGVSFETNGNFISKNKLPKTPERKDLTFYAMFNKIDDRNYIIKFPNTKSKVNIQIFDYKGSEILIEAVTSELAFKFPCEGIYYLIADNGKEILKRSINTFDTDLSTLTNSFPLIVNPNSICTFIAYKKFFKPDTLADIDISTTDTLNFAIKDTSKYNFRGGTLEIKGLSVKIINKYSSRKTPISEWTTNVDTSFDKINISCKFANTGTVCTHKDNTNNEINFCYSESFKRDKDITSLDMYISKMNIIQSKITSIQITIKETTYLNYSGSMIGYNNTIIFINNLSFDLNDKIDTSFYLLNQIGFKSDSDAGGSQYYHTSSNSENIQSNDTAIVTLILNL